MAEKDQVYHQHMRLSCGLLALALSLTLITPLILAITHQRHLVRYPEARLIPGRTKYILRLRHLRLENAYLVPAPLTTYATGMQLVSICGRSEGKMAALRWPGPRSTLSSSATWSFGSVRPPAGRRSLSYGPPCSCGVRR